jgi:hypothetical protein
MSHVTIARDPFARESVIRRKAPHGSCAWCGTRARLWEYGTESDAGRAWWSHVWVCCIGCDRAYRSF